MALSKRKGGINPLSERTESALIWLFEISLAGAAVIFSRTDTTQSPHEISRMVQVWQSIIMIKMINAPTDTTVCL
jgi:hypothetical protein